MKLLYVLTNWSLLLFNISLVIIIKKTQKFQKGPKCVIINRHKQTRNEHHQIFNQNLDEYQGGQICIPYVK